MNAARWSGLMGAFRMPPSPETFRKLSDAYNAKSRHYHNAGHIGACLAGLDEFRTLAALPHEVELALWFHDAVYSPHASDNEEKSAILCREFLLGAGQSAEVAARIEGHILATRHQEEALEGDGALVVDLDLSILGAERPRYQAFEKGVRKEYRWVPAFLFRKKRIEILSGFLARMKIYHHAPIRDRLEERARENMTWAIAALETKEL